MHRQHHEGEVDLAAFEPCLELVVDRGLRQLDVHLRELLLEAAHQDGEEASADALVRTDTQRACRSFGERGEVGLRCLHARHDRLCVPQQQLARLGQRDGARAARPLDQLLAHGALEGSHLLADRGLRVAERLRGPAEGTVLRDRLERHQVAQLEREKTIRLHNQRHHNIDLC